MIKDVEILQSSRVVELNLLCDIIISLNVLVNFLRFSDDNKYIKYIYGFIFNHIF